MTAVLAWLDFPIAGAGIASGALVVGMLILYRIISDRSAVVSELNTLRHQVEDVQRQHAETLRHVAKIERLYDEQRGMKHQAYNDVARALTALELVRRLSSECTCGVLSPLGDIIERILNEMETSRRRPLDAG